MQPWKRKEVIGDATLYLGDCRDILPSLEADCVVTDPPYGVTSLDWDLTVDNWVELVHARSLWCFGSMKFFISQRFPGWTYAQEIVWEKHNGSMFHADRFKRVHEFALHFYRGAWASLYKSPQFTLDATARTTRRKQRPAHSGHIDAANYVSKDGGPRLQRSVIYARSMHGRAVHPTEKPIEILMPLIQYSCPSGGVVLDPFFGSASSAEACYHTGRKFIGIEIHEPYFDIGCKRLREVLQQKKLFA